MSKQEARRKIEDLISGQAIEQQEELKGLHIGILHYDGKFVIENIFIKNYSEEWNSIKAITEEEVRKLVREYPGALLVHFHKENEDMRKSLPNLTRRCMNVPLDEKQQEIIEAFFSSDFKKAQSLPIDRAKIWYSKSPEIDYWLRTEVIWKDRIRTLAMKQKQNITSKKGRSSND